MLSCAHPLLYLYLTSLQPVSISEMKGATTVFVGNITDKATDTLMKQILLVSLSWEFWSW